MALVEDAPKTKVKQKKALQYERVKPVNDDVVQNSVTGDAWKLILVNPEKLMIDREYQRELGKTGNKLLRSMIENWSWSKFTPPRVGLRGGKMFLIDGKTTSIAAATRGDIDQIPVYIVGAVGRQGEARLFKEVNSERVGTTPIQRHRANITAGNATAVLIDKTAKLNGIKIPDGNYSTTSLIDKTNVTLSISEMYVLAERRSVSEFRKIMRCIGALHFDPVRRDHFKVVDALLFDETYNFARKLNRVILSMKGLHQDDVLKEAERMRIGSRLPRWVAMTRIYAAKIREDLGE